MEAPSHNHVGSRAVSGSSADVDLDTATATVIEAMGGEESSGADVMSQSERRLGIRHRNSFVLSRAPMAPGHERPHPPSSLGETISSIAAAVDGGNYDALDGIEEDGLEEGGHVAIRSDSSSDDSQSSGSAGLSSGSPKSARDSSSLAASVGGMSLSGSASAASPSKAKSRLNSIAKGLASALGLRKGKKKRAAEEAAAQSARQSFPPPPISSPSPTNSGNSSLRGLDNIVVVGSADEPYDYATVRDGEGDFSPSHRRHPGRPHSILKGSPYAVPAANTSSRSSERCNISFADQHGHDLQSVRFSERLHYSEGSEHIDWDSGPLCVVA